MPAPEPTREPALGSGLLGCLCSSGALIAAVGTKVGLEEADEDRELEGDGDDEGDGDGDEEVDDALNGDGLDEDTIDSSGANEAKRRASLMSEVTRVLLDRKWNTRDGAPHKTSTSRSRQRGSARSHPTS